MNNSANKTLNIVLTILVSLTLIGAGIAENINPTNLITIAICITIAFKGFLVADYFMELKNALPIIRWTIQAYIIILPLLICLSILFQEVLKKILF